MQKTSFEHDRFPLYEVKICVKFAVCAINFIAIVFEGDLLKGRYNYTFSCISNACTNIRKLPAQTTVQL